MDRPRSAPADFAELVGVSPGLAAGRDPFLMRVVNETPLQAHSVSPDLALGIYLSGRHKVRCQIGPTAIEGWSDPGTINLTAPGVEGVWEASASSRAAVMVIRSNFLSRAVEEHWSADSRKVEFANQFLVRDPVIEAVILNLTSEVSEGSPRGQIYRDSSIEFVAHHLIHRYSNLSRPPSQVSGGLSSRRLRLVLDCIEDTLDQSPKLRELAALAGVSVRHFERAFRQSTGLAPHAYIMERRLRTARELLIGQPNLPIERIRVRLGFSSSSHFSSAFRRWTGVTPQNFRKTWPS